MLSNFRILTKIIGIIVMLSCVAAGIAYLGISSLKSLDEATDRMQLAAANALETQRLSVSVVAINRAEFRIAADPRPENYQEARKVIETELGLFRQRFDNLDKKMTGPQRAKLDEIQAKFRQYLGELDGTYKAAEAVIPAAPYGDSRRLLVEGAA
jgi:methyl-accepting chemotaxis protein